LTAASFDVVDCFVGQTSSSFDVVDGFVGVLTSVHSAVGYAFGATHGELQGELPLGTPAPCGGLDIPPVETTKVAVGHPCCALSMGRSRS